MRFWRISDVDTNNGNNHRISYDIRLDEMGHQDIGPASEPFTQNDFYVTKQNNNEKFASHNTSGGKNLAEFTNGESIIGNDVVIWAGVTFYHMPRSEDAPHMDAHWSHFQIIPRDWSEKNSLSSIVSNIAPIIQQQTNKSSIIESQLSVNNSATDPNGDSLTYSATGLPIGLAINTTTGQISGTVTTAGNYSVVITVSDGQLSDTTQFNWSVMTDDSESSGGGGAVPLNLLLFLLGISVIRKKKFRIKL